MSVNFDDGLQRLREFAEFLRMEGIAFSLNVWRTSVITVDFILLGREIQVDFDPDQMSFTRIRGAETGTREDAALDALLNRFTQTISRQQPPREAPRDEEVPQPFHDLLWLHACFRNRQSAF